MSRRSSPTLEIRYALLAVTLGAALFLIGRLGFVTRAANDLFAAMNSFAGIGLLGIFVVALFANMSLFIQVPYTLPLLSAALGGASVARMTSLGVAAGLGAACGAIVSFRLAHVVLARNPHLPRSSLFQWIARHVECHPGKIVSAILVVLVTPLPDDAVIVPLATVRYPLRRFVPLALTGKVAHNLLVAMLFSAFSWWAKDHVSHTVSVNVALIVMALFVLTMCYQAEKARAQADPSLAAQTPNAAR